MLLANRSNVETDERWVQRCDTVNEFKHQASDTEEVVTPLMQDGTYLSRNFATLGPLTLESPCV